MPALRLVLCALSAVLALKAGADMRSPGSGIEPPFRLVAYAGALWVLAYGAAGMALRRSTGPQDEPVGRSWYDD